MDYMYDVYVQVPPVTRCMLLLSLGLACLTTFTPVTEYHLYFNFRLIKNLEVGTAGLTLQLWRFVTSIFYFGDLNAKTLFCLYVVRNLFSSIERRHFKNRPADFILFICYGCFCFQLVSVQLGWEFISPSLLALTLYYWVRMNPNFIVNVFEVFHIRAPYFPLFMIIMRYILDQNYFYDIVGFTVGHIYYFVDEVVPKLPDTGGQKLLRAPQALADFCAPLHNF